MNRVIVWSGREGSPDRLELIVALEPGQSSNVAVKAFKVRYGRMPEGLWNVPASTHS